MSNHSVIIQPEAETDLDEAYFYLESQKSGLGFELLSFLSEILELLEQNPFLFQKVLNNKRRAIIKKFNYNVIYEIDGKYVYILTIIHGNQNPQAWQER